MKHITKSACSYIIFMEAFAPLLVVGYVFLVIWGNFEIVCLYPESLFRVLVFIAAILKGCSALKKHKNDELFEISLKQSVCTIIYTILVLPLIVLSLTALFWLICEICFSS